MVFLGRVKGTAVKKATDNPFHTILYRVSLFIRIPFKAVSICGDDMQKQITICDYLLFFRGTKPARSNTAHAHYWAIRRGSFLFFSAERLREKRFATF